MGCINRDENDDGNCTPPGRGQITDNDLGHLSGLTKLQNLNLGMCDQITDRGLGYLSGLTSLKVLI